MESQGFTDYYKFIKGMKKERKFWELSKTRDGYSKKVSKHFNEKFLPEIGVWKG